MTEDEYKRLEGFSLEYDWRFSWSKVNRDDRRPLFVPREWTNDDVR